MTDWTASPGPEWYRPADAAEAGQMLINADRPAVAVRAIAHLADAVGNDQSVRQ
jgi:Flp pilus assembly CpaE family ATPase